MRTDVACRNKDFKVYRRGVPSKGPHPAHVLSLLFYKWRQDAVVFSAYLAGWPEGETESTIALCGGASGTVRRVGNKWEVTVDMYPPDEPAKENLPESSRSPDRSQTEGKTKKQ